MPAGLAESDFRKHLEAQTLLGRIGQPQDIAPAAVFLASPDAAWITGETLLIAGGALTTIGRLGSGLRRVAGSARAGRLGSATCWPVGGSTSRRT
jgi:hypothetical protein